jgi:hypothetical protein
MRGRILKWDPVKREVIEVDRAHRLIHANAAHGFIPDEMDAVKHPAEHNGQYYTSKSKFRAVTKAHGLEEVGTAYENGYDPGVGARDDMKDLHRGMMNELRERMNS